MSAAPANREDFFQNEMKREISQSSLNWFTKKALLLFFPFIYRFIGRYTNNLVSNFETEINKRISSLDKNKLLLRSSNCFSQYNALLKTWADKPEGGDKDVVIGELMKEKRFLSFKDASFSQQTLYEKLSLFITTKYCNLFSGPTGNVGPSSIFDSFKQKIDSVVGAPVFNNRRGSFTNTLNKLCIAIKWITLGIPAHIAIFVASLPVKGWENLMNRLVVKAAHSYLGDYQVLHSLFDATKKDVFENDTYVYPITRFFADQFETLSRTLARGVKDGEGEESEDSFVLSDQARASLKSTFQNLFEVIRKNAFTTQDELKAFLEKEKGVTGKLKDDFDALLIDSIIDITYKAYNDMLSEDSLQNSLLMLLENLNQSLLADPTQSEEKRKADHLKHQKAQEKLTKYSEKVLHQIIDQVITNGLDSMTHNQSAGSTQFITWIKKDLDNLVKNYNDTLDQLEDDTASAQDKLAALESLRQKRSAFQDKLESKFERFKGDNSKVAQTLKAKLDPVFLQLNALLEKQLEIYTKQKELCLVENDRPHFSACLEAFNSLAASLEDLQNHNNDVADQNNLGAQFEFLKSYLEKIQQLDATLGLQRASQNYALITEGIANYKEAFRKTLENVLTNPSPQALQEAIDTMKELQTHFEVQVNDFDEKIEKNTVSEEDLEAFKEIKEYLVAAYEALEPMDFIEGKIDSVNALKKVPHAVVYHAIKPKMQGILDLLRNGNFAQFFLNHALVMPLVTKA
jgi:hypothetical protein